MGRLIGIDFGLVRTGIAVSDPLQIVASPLETVPTKTCLHFLQQYAAKESINSFVIGYPLNLDGTDTDSTAAVRTFVEKLKKAFPGKQIHLEDERFSSKRAMEQMIQMGVKKKKRKEKGIIDRMSAVIILQSYMQSL